MATKLNQYERQSRPGPDSPYPWDDWLAPGSTWKLSPGEDFDCKPSSFTDLARRHAKRLGVRLSVYSDGEDLVLVTAKNDKANFGG